jgi:processive 1,2-diacylglycerol beta-glucosyltransferase
MRILIATITAGGGHLAAASALEEHWRAWRPEDTLEKVDLLRFFSPLHRKITKDGYVKLVEHAPEVWGMVFKKTDKMSSSRRINELKRALPSNSRRKFTKYLDEFQPDAVLCTHYLPLEALGLECLKTRELSRKKSSSKNSTELKTLPVVASIVTDFEAHALWMDDCVDIYCVASENTKGRMVARGVSAEKIRVTGIPISKRFSDEINTGAIKKKMGLRDDLPTILVLGGGFGMGPVAEILVHLDKSPGTFQTVVVTGKNEELRKEISGVDRNHPTHVLGFATNMHELMAISNLIVTKPGGLTTSEALALGKPLMILDPIPGQEAANSDFLLERGAAIKLNRVEDLPYRLEEFLGHKKLLQMGKAAARLGRPHAAQDVCEAVLESLNAKTAGKIPAQQVSPMVR